MLKRRRQLKTDYRLRLALLRSGKPRLVVRRSHGNIHVQVVAYQSSGDSVLLEESATKLRTYGWKGHCGNLSAAYLLGLLAGKKAHKSGIASAVLDLGLQASTKGNALYALAQGCRDAGLEVAVSESIAPDAGRITGAHVAAYAAQLKGNAAAYKKQFSSYLRNSLNPEDLPRHVEEVRKKIAEA